MCTILQFATFGRSFHIQKYQQILLIVTNSTDLFIQSWFELFPCSVSKLRKVHEVVICNIWKMCPYSEMPANSLLVIVTHDFSTVLFKSNDEIDILRRSPQTYVKYTGWFIWEQPHCNFLTVPTLNVEETCFSYIF